MQFNFVPISKLWNFQRLKGQKELAMISFTPDFLESFMSTVRKYMQIRGGLSQKDLLEMTNVGISTMSRFLNMKTNTIDEQLIANLIATLSIPLSEVIDGIDEESTDTFKRLVQFYKDQKKAEKDREAEEVVTGLDGHKGGQTKTTASIKLGGRTQDIHFGEAAAEKHMKSEGSFSIKEKLQTLSPRQKAYLTDFLNLEVSDRDLIVDLGDAIFRYLRQRSLDF